MPVDKAINNKRLQADLLVESCNEQREKYLKKAYELEQQLIYIDLYKKRFEELKREVEKLNNSIPYEFKSIYELNYNLRRG